MNQLFETKPTNKYVLRDYQTEAVKAGIDFFRNGKKGKNEIIVMPTGSGKSLIIASIAEKLTGGTLVLQPSKEILEQNYRKMIEFGVPPHRLGIYSASLNRKEARKITFATIGSVIRKLDQFDHVKNVIIDECHLVNAKGGQYAQLIEHFGGKTLGLTATPYRLHAFRDMYDKPCVVAKFLTRTRPKVFDSLCHVTQVGKLYRDGFLCPVKYVKDSGYDQTAIGLNSTGMDFDDASLKRYNETMDLVGKVATHIRENRANHTLVFCTFVSEADKLSKDLNALGISSAVISGKTPPKDREKLLEDFQAGRIKVITNVGVLTTGFDFPAIDCLILSRPTQSVALYYQMVGRGIRIHPSKKFVTVIDLCGNVDRFGSIESFEVIKGDTRTPRLQSDASFLTGYDFVSNTDVEKSSSFVGSDEKEYDYMPFGKHQGERLSQLPLGYLSWASESLTDKPGLVKSLKKELARRKGK